MNSVLYLVLSYNYFIWNQLNNITYIILNYILFYSIILYYIIHDLNMTFMLLKIVAPTP